MSSARIEENNFILAAKMSLMSLFFLSFLQDVNQDGHADYNENKINRNEVGDKVDLEYRNHRSQIEIKTDYK